MGHGVRTEGRPAGVRNRAAENWKRSEVKPGRDKVKGTWRGRYPCRPEGRLGWPERVAWKRLAWARQKHTWYQERKDMLSRSESSYWACCVHIIDRIDMAKLQREAPHTVIRRGQKGDTNSELGSTLNPTGRIKSFRFCNSFVTSDRTYGGLQDTE